jgi:uncharacterized protein (TIGR04255 family)
LPLFENPPVTEINMGLLLHGVALRTVDLGDLYSRFADRYPTVEEHIPPPLQVENFAQRMPSGIRFELQNRPAVPTLIFFAEDRSSLVQIDADRFFSAWRRSTGESRYPRYERFRSEFLRNAEIFADFADSVGIGDISVRQCEISYINEIQWDGVTRPDTLATALPLVDDDPVSAVSISQHFTYRTDSGLDYARLHVVSEPAIRDGEAIIRLVLTYRGEFHERFPEAEGIAGIMRFLDEGHDKIVKAFASNTTVSAHDTWVRLQ